MANVQPTPGAFMLAQRLRELREHGLGRRLTQSEVGLALAGGDVPLTPSAISMWENAANERVPPVPRLAEIARLYCTPRSLEGREGGVRLLSDAELTAPERERMAELRQELLDLREAALADPGDPVPERTRSMWHFPDGSRITLACSRLAEERRPPYSNPAELNYVHWADLADLDTLIEIYGAIRAYNPTSRVVIRAAQDLNKNDIANHLVLIGGLSWEIVTPSLSRIFPIPILAGDPGVRDAIVVKEEGGKEHEFRYTLADDKLVEDVGFFARGENPSAPRRTLTICGGITTRGVRGAAQCFIDWEMRERNDQWLLPRFPDGSNYCIVMRVPVVNNEPLTPDLSKDENRLFEWSNAGPATE